MSKMKIKLPDNLTDEEIEELRRTKGGCIEEPRRSGCMLILILPLILSLTMIFLISL